MHPDDREDIAQFAYEAMKGMVDAQGGVDGRGMRKPDPGFVKVCENAGIELQDLIKGLVEGGVAGMVKAELPPGQIHSFRDLMMPALVRVGAVTRAAGSSTPPRASPCGRTRACSSRWSARLRRTGALRCPGYCEG
jgi:hypothetical protein